MIDDTSVLVMLVGVMLVGSYTAGSIPLIVRLSEDKLKKLTVLGGGLLVGTALTVIIPEGIRSLYVGSKHLTNMAHLSSPVALLNDNKNEQMYNEFKDHSRTIGLSLALGFVFMMLIDQLAQRRDNSTTSNEKNITATLGLVVHAAADGIALGAAATTSHHDVELIVFLAIMLHKAPAAFGLVSFLLHEKIDRQQIRKHLAIFSFAAPLLTLLTYFSIGQEQKKTLDAMNATGIAMLFSAGTFLYVATVHVLPELTHEDGGSSHMHGQKNIQYNYIHLEEAATSSDVQLRVSNINGRHTISKSGLRCIELIIMIFGTLLPLVITFGHHH